jgi:hypothetical protein
MQGAALARCMIRVRIDCRKFFSERATEFALELTHSITDKIRGRYLSAAFALVIAHPRCALGQAPERRLRYRP